MEEYTNRELGLLMVGIKEDIKDLKTTHHDSMVTVKKTLYGNGKKGLVEQVNDLKTWKYAVVAIGSMLAPIAIIVLKEVVEKLFS